MDIEKTLLLIDDNFLFRKLTKEALKDKNYQILEASNGEEGLALLNQKIPDLIITDVLMPTMDGYEFLRRLRSEPQFQNIKVIFYTGTFSGVDEKALAQSGGVVSLVAKPAAPEELKQIVKNTLNFTETKTPDLRSDYTQEHLRILTNQLSRKVDLLESLNEELQLEVDRRSKAEAEARESKASIERLLNSLPQMAWHLREDGQIDYVNNRWKTFYKTEEQHFHLDDWIASVEPRDQSEARKLVLQAIRSLQPFRFEIRLRPTPEEEPKYHLISSILLSGQETKLHSWICTATDISSQKNYEEKLTQLHHQSEALSQAKTEFLNNISHEMRTPLTAILGFSELLIETVRAPETPFLERIKYNAKHLTSILDDIISISDLEANRASAPLNVRFTIDDFLECLEESKKRAETKGLYFHLEMTPETRRTYSSNPEILKRILSHLLDNAIKFTKNGGINVKVKFQDDTHQDTERLIFEIEDTGIGIAPEKYGSLFKPFQQVDSSSTRQYEGLGLGLLVSSKLAEAIGAKIEIIYSTPGIGSCFQLSTKIRTLD